MILKPLQRIQVVESKKKCKPGSLGYLVAQDPAGNYNAWNMCIVFTRFGNKGMPRIEALPISSLMIDYDTMKPADRDILYTANIYEGLEPRIYTDRRGNIKDNVRETTIEPIQTTGPKDLLELPTNEFTAYMVSMSMFIYKLIHGKPARNLHLCPPNIRFRSFVSSRFDLAAINPENFGYQILNGIQSDESLKRRQSPLEDNLNFGLAYTRQINNARKKKQLLDRLQRSLAMTKDRLNTYNKTAISRFNKIPHRIDDVLKFYRHNKKELKILKDKNDKQRDSINYYTHHYGYKPRVDISPKLIITDDELIVEEIEI